MSTLQTFLNVLTLAGLSAKISFQCRKTVHEKTVFMWRRKAKTHKSTFWKKNARVCATLYEWLSCLETSGLTGWETNSYSLHPPLSTSPSILYSILWSGLHKVLLHFCGVASVFATQNLFSGLVIVLEAVNWSVVHSFVFTTCKGIQLYLSLSLSHLRAMCDGEITFPKSQAFLQFWWHLMIPPWHTCFAFNCRNRLPLA